MPGYVANYLHGEGAAAAVLLLRFKEPTSSRTPEFQLLARELCMQIVAMKPLAIAPSDLDESVWREELARLRGSPSLRGLSSEEQMSKLRAARENYERNLCLLKQPFIKSNRLTVQERISEVEEVLSEHIELIRFSLLEAKDAE